MLVHNIISQAVVVDHSVILPVPFGIRPRMCPKTGSKSIEHLPESVPQAGPKSVPGSVPVLVTDMADIGPGWGKNASPYLREVAQ
jgi:hypothetical protein